MRLVTLNWRRISYLKMAGNNESKVRKMKRSFFLSNSIYIRGRNFKQSLEVNLVPRALFPGFGGGARPQSQGNAPWGRGCLEVYLRDPGFD